MGSSDWNWRLAHDAQDMSWDCAACSTAWCLRAIGLDYSEADVVAGLGSGRINPYYGLLDASGAGLVSYLLAAGATSFLLLVFSPWLSEAESGAIGWLFVWAAFAAALLPLIRCC